MMADDGDIIYFTPHLLRGGRGEEEKKALGGMFSDSLLLGFLVSTDVFHAPINSLTFSCCSLSSVFLLQQFLSLLLFCVCSAHRSASAPPT